ncbi:cation:proton antiporter, partial [uncultured Porphyromonas sp.]|uniref:cation:proton antiporter domain-containing protein n=1 Tax=uncultured Porphyromonas sp. TaxID=159274 RepID=UPI0025CD81D1
MAIEQLIFYISLLAIVGLVLSKAGFRFGIPSLLLFLGVGMFAGYSGYLEFNSASEAQTIGIIALTMILFTGGMDTDYKEIKPVMVRGTLLATVGVLLTMLVTGTFIYFLFRQPWVPGEVQALSFPMALLCAAVMSSTDSASVFSILRSKEMHLRHNVKPLLEFESGSNDPMAYMLTLILLQMIHTGDSSIGNALWMFVLQFSIGGVLGYGFGKGAVWFVNKVKLASPALHSLLLLFVAFVIYSATARLGGNGYLAVYISGLVVGNSEVLYK